MFVDAALETDASEVSVILGSVASGVSRPSRQRPANMPRPKF